MNLLNNLIKIQLVPNNITQITITSLERQIIKIFNSYIMCTLIVMIKVKYTIL